MSGHTKGRIEAVQHGGPGSRWWSIMQGAWDVSHNQAGRPGVVADSSYSAMWPEENEANAHRLVACWNACEGMADPEAEVAGLRAQRDALLRLALAWRGALTEWSEDIRLSVKSIPAELHVAKLMEDTDAAIAMAEGEELRAQRGEPIGYAVYWNDPKDCSSKGEGWEFFKSRRVAELNLASDQQAGFTEGRLVVLYDSVITRAEGEQ